MQDARTWAALAAPQAGVLSRQQCVEAGASAAGLTRRVASGQWQRLHPGVLLTHGGPVTDLARVWAALLHAGPGAVASSTTAAWLDGLVDAAPAVLEVSVPEVRRVAARRGVRVRRRRDLPDLVHPSRSPPRTRVEQTVMDLVDTARDEGAVVRAVLGACQRRLTTPDRLAAAAAARSRLRWRALVTDLLDDARDGVTTALERAYVRGVERSHGLPRGERNRPEGPRGARRYRDVRYRRYRTVVELDGSEWHPPGQGWRDRRRDNEVAEQGCEPLRYGWEECTVWRCETAVRTARVLQQRGWAGRPVPCGPGCAVAPAFPHPASA